MFWRLRRYLSYIRYRLGLTHRSSVRLSWSDRARIVLACVYAVLLPFYDVYLALYVTSRLDVRLATCLALTLLVLYTCFRHVHVMERARRAKFLAITILCLSLSLIFLGIVMLLWVMVGTIYLSVIGLSIDLAYVATIFLLSSFSLVLSSSRDLCDCLFLLLTDPEHVARKIMEMEHDKRRRRLVATMNQL